MKIPFVDLYAQYLSIKEEIDSAIFSTIEKSAYIGGEAVKEFEKNWSQHLDVRHTISCANGTDSLEILLKAMGVGVGDEVIVPAISWISTSEAVSAVGAKPIFVDIHPDYYTMDENLIEEKISSRTKAIIPVHLYGHPANMSVIMNIAKTHNLKVIEDCAQSHDATILGKKVGTFGDAASFSFYPGKNLGAYGDAGCMTTNDDNIASLARMIANHGQLKKHDHQIEGRNSRLDGMQAAVLNVKLKYLTQWTERRIEIAEKLINRLERSNLLVPKIKQDFKHVFHLFVIRVQERSKIIDILKEKGIEVAIHYPTALPFLPAYRHLNYKTEDFPVASTCQNCVLSLPMYPELSFESIDFICNILIKSIDEISHN